MQLFVKNETIGQKSKFSSKIKIFIKNKNLVRNLNFRPKIKIFIKNKNLVRNLNLRPKIKIFIKNQNFRTKINIFTQKNKLLVQKSKIGCCPKQLTFFRCAVKQMTISFFLCFFEVT